MVSISDCAIQNAFFLSSCTGKEEFANEKRKRLPNNSVEKKRQSSFIVSFRALTAEASCVEAASMR